MRKIYIFIVLVFIGIISYGANFSVAPTRFELDVNNVAVNEVHILNNTDRPLRIETYFESDKNFGEEYNLNENLAVFPKVIAIKPAGKQVVRFRVKPSENLKDGESKSYIVFKEIPPAIKSTGAEEQGEGMATNMSILTEIGISIYGSKGDSIVKGKFENVKIKSEKENIFINGDIISEGNTSIKLKYMVENSGGKILSEGRLGNSSRTGKTSIGLNLGKIEGMKGKEVTIKVFDQNDKLYCEKKTILK